MDYNNIPLSSDINNLKNNKNVQNNEIYINNNIDLDNDIGNDIDLDEILDNQIIYDNNFIKKILSNSNLKDKDSIPHFHNIVKIYLTKMKKDTFPRNCNNKFFTLLIRITHIIGIIYIIIGCLSPRKLLKYHIVFCIKTLILWEFLEDKCYMSILIQKISNLNKCPKFIPEDITFSKNIVLFTMFLSIIGIIIPNFSLYKIILNTINWLKKYD